MNFLPEYFKKEIIDGFEVSSLMKRCWAAQLEVLEQFDEVCRQHSIRYFLGYGTLLGAVRHGGFIPWDDDIDIWMLREDLDRLMRETVPDLTEKKLELVTPFSDGEYYNLAFRIINTRHSYCLTDDFLNKYWLFPFMAGLDIFPIDYVPRDESALQNIKTLMVSANVLAQQWDNPEINPRDKLELYAQLTGMLGVAQETEDKAANHLWRLTDRIGAMYCDEESDMVTIWYDYVANPDKLYHKEWFSEEIYLEFEGVKYPCPIRYKEALEVEFGKDYMIPKITHDTHAYPYYKRAYENMKRTFEQEGVKLPEIYDSI